MNIFKSIERNWNKRNVVQAIANAEQQNNDVVTIHRIDKKNIGDYVLELDRNKNKMISQGNFSNNIKIIFTKNIQETCTFILTFCSKIIEKPEHFKKDIQQTSNDYVECLKIKSKKIDNITPDICYIMQLSQIPHISTKIAKNIQKKYSTMKELINILESTTDKITLLSIVFKALLV